MRVVVFDTETTGFMPGNICQLSYIIDDSGPVLTKNLYFKVGYVEPGAERVHGLSVPVLDKLSGGRAFADCAEEIYNDFMSCGFWIAHNYDFDRRFLEVEFRRAGIEFFGKKHFCTMRGLTSVCKLPRAGKKYSPGGYKYPRLSELMDCLGISTEEITKQASALFSTPETSGFHDARVDTAAVYLCYKKGVCHPAEGM